MTNFNKTFGEFAAGESEDFMVMNRNYERDEKDDSLISDLSTYIDPSKYNQIFADVSLSAQNFWVQTAVQMESRTNKVDKNVIYLSITDARSIDFTFNEREYRDWETDRKSVV